MCEEIKEAAVEVAEVGAIRLVEVAMLAGGPYWGWGRVSCRCCLTLFRDARFARQSVTHIIRGGRSGDGRSHRNGKGGRGGDTGRESLLGGGVSYRCRVVLFETSQSPPTVPGRQAWYFRHRACTRSDSERPPNCRALSIWSRPPQLT